MSDKDPPNKGVPSTGSREANKDEKKNDKERIHRKLEDREKRKKMKK
jgi:hypothetical protein